MSHLSLRTKPELFLFQQQSKAVSLSADVTCSTQITAIKPGPRAIAGQNGTNY